MSESANMLVRRVLLGIVLSVAIVSSSLGQVRPFVDEEAEIVFGQAIDAFEAGDYGMAARRFRLVADEYPLHRRTTAAMVMEAKAHYRLGDRDQAGRIAERLVEEYPRSEYVPAARALLSIIEAAVDTRVITLGITLPLDAEHQSLSRALFTGIRAAVEEYNLSGRSGVVRMVFEDSQGTVDGAQRAVGLLIDKGVDVIVGPLYSDEAVAAARVAEANGVTLITPMATDDAVSRGRRYVFQANPSIRERGAAMARFAVTSLRMDSLAVVAELGDGLSESMAESFRRTAQGLGADVRFVKYLEGTSQWFRLQQVVTADSLVGLDGLYLPIAGGSAQVKISAVLDALDRMSPGLRLLGNGEWHDIPPKAQASAYAMTYTNDFHVDRDRMEVQEFERRYEEMSGELPNRLSYAGYDVAAFVLRVLEVSPVEDIGRSIRSAPPYDGLGVRISFGGGNVNQALFFQRYRDGEIALLR